MSDYNKDTEQKMEWVQDEIAIQFRRYDSDAFAWQGIIIPKDTSESPLQGYERELLASVGLQAEEARVLGTCWMGEAYEADGILCRNAVARIERLVPVSVEECKELEVVTQVMEEPKEERSLEESVTQRVQVPEVVEKRDYMGWILLGILLLVVLIGLFFSKKRKNKQNICHNP